MYQAAYMLFGKKLENYGSFAGSVEALFSFALGDFDFDSLKDTQKVMTLLSAGVCCECVTACLFW